jgi:hypothetical protein
MFADDNVVEEKTSLTSGQIAMPMNIQLTVSCEINPANPAKPLCRIKYLRPQFLGISEEVEDEVDATVTTEEETSQKVKKSPPKTDSKKSKSTKDEDDNSSDDDDNEDDDADEETPVLRCVAESFDRD